MCTEVGEEIDVLNLIEIAVLLTSASLVAVDDARPIVERAVIAHGGKDQLAKLSKARRRIEGTTNQVMGQVDVPFIREDEWDLPLRCRSVVKLEVKGQVVSVEEVLNDEAGWTKWNGMTDDLSKEAFREMQERMHLESVIQLNCLTDGTHELSVLEHIERDGVPLVGVRVKSLGKRDIDLYFDKTTGLLARYRESVGDRVSDKQTIQETVLSGYENINGVRYFRDIVVLKDGGTMLRGRIKMLEIVAKHEASAFSKP